MATQSERALLPAITWAPPVVAARYLKALHVNWNFHTRNFDAVIFDMDGVITRTATLHAEAWKRTFDSFLRSRSAQLFVAFDSETDYRRYVDGKPRLDGVVSFLASRQITVPLGGLDDGPDQKTVFGLANHKDQLFQGLLGSTGVGVFESTIDFISSIKLAGLKVGVFSASKHAEQILSAAEVMSLFDAKVDGIDADELGLPGKPHPATLLELARRLRIGPERCAVVEDAIAGVQAGRAGGFAHVIGVNRGQLRGALLDAGADIEVTDLSELVPTT